MTVFSDFVLGELTNSVSDSATTIRVTHASPYNRFPDPSGETSQAIISDDLRVPTKFEVVTYTGITVVDANTTDLTGVTRGRDGTTAESFSGGAAIRQDIVASNLRLLEQQEPSLEITAGSSDSTVRRFDDLGNEVWVFEGADERIDNVCLDDRGRCFAFSRSGFVHAIDQDGSEIWSDDTSKERCSGLAASSAGIVVGSFKVTGNSPGHILVAYDAADGTELWNYDISASSITGNPIHIDVDNDGYVLVSTELPEQLCLFSPEGYLLHHVTADEYRYSVFGEPGFIYTRDAAVGSNRFVKLTYGMQEVWSTTSSVPTFIHYGDDGELYSLEFGGGFNLTVLKKRDKSDGSVLETINLDEAVYTAAINITNTGEAVYLTANGVARVGTDGAPDWESDTFLGPIQSCAIRPTRGGLALVQNGSIQSGRVRHSDVGGSPVVRSLLALKSSLEPSTPPTGHVFLYFDGTDVVVKFDNGGTSVIASKTP